MERGRVEEGEIEEGGIQGKLKEEEKEGKGKDEERGSEYIVKDQTKLKRKKQTNLRR